MRSLSKNRVYFTSRPSRSRNFGINLFFSILPLRIPPQEIANQFDATVLALLGMELGRDDIVFGDDRRHLLAVVRPADEVAGVVAVHRKTVHEIKGQIAVADIREHGMVALTGHAV